VDALRVQVLNRTREAGIPQDVQFVDIDYMDGRRDFTYDKVWESHAHCACTSHMQTNFGQLPQLIDSLHTMHMRNILILDPAIPLDYAPFKQGLDVRHIPH
jgi:alpha-glucosidase (family GH31 glycosyl hydrolase)